MDARLHRALGELLRKLYVALRFTVGALAGFVGVPVLLSLGVALLALVLIGFEFLGPPRQIGRPNSLSSGRDITNAGGASVRWVWGDAEIRLVCRGGCDDLLLGGAAEGADVEVRDRAGRRLVVPDADGGAGFLAWLDRPKPGWRPPLRPVGDAFDE